MSKISVKSHLFLRPYETACLPGSAATVVLGQDQWADPPGPQGQTLGQGQTLDDQAPGNVTILIEFL